MGFGSILSLTQDKNLVCERLEYVSNLNLVIANAVTVADLEAVDISFAGV